MKREVLLERLQIYKKEIYRRAYVMLFMAFLPLVIIFLVIGLSFNIISFGIFEIIAYFGAFLLFMAGIIWWFANMVHTAIPKKIGLLCPNCNAPIIKNNVEEFMKNGLCSKCGTKILED